MTAVTIPAPRKIEGPFPAGPGDPFPFYIVTDATGRELIGRTYSLPAARELAHAPQVACELETIMNRAEEELGQWVAVSLLHTPLHLHAVSEIYDWAVEAAAMLEPTPVALAVLAPPASAPGASDEPVRGQSDLELPAAVTSRRG